MTTGRPPFAAVDLGAESGRVVLGRVERGRVTLEEAHRFANQPVRVLSTLHWDALRLLHEVKLGLGEAGRRAGGSLAGVGVDAWGVDFGLLDRAGVLIGNPFHYRDPRTEGMIDRALERVPEEELYATTGIQAMPLNTLYQLLASEGSPALASADTLLSIADLMTYWLTGERRAEQTIASTTQLYDPRARGWASELIERLGIPTRIFPELVRAGTWLGPLTAAVAEEVGLGGEVGVTAVAEHDTASAVVAVPAESERFAYISSGTWSLVGVELDRPAITDEGRRANLANEVGFGDTFRLLKNVMGLWLLQECRRAWARAGHDRSYAELVELAGRAPRGGALVDPDHPDLLAPGDMPRRIRGLCERTGQDPPEEAGPIVRCVLESLACKYRVVLESAERVSGRHTDIVHVVGGGSRNELLCQLTAETAARPVLAGPAEATALGNVMVQAHAAGLVGSLVEIRRMVRDSFVVRRYEPKGGDAGPKMLERFLAITA